MLMALLIASVFYSCGPSIKVTETWKAPDLSAVKKSKVLVMARLDDLASRQLFEQEITKQLSASGFKAVPSYVEYPDLKLNKKMDSVEVDSHVAKFKNDGFGAVVLTVIKDVNTDIRTEDSGGYSVGGYYPYAYSGYGGFGNYYGGVYTPYSSEGYYVPRSERTYESDIYKLETVVYAINRSEKKQLVGVVASQIKDPGSASDVAEPYAKKVLAQFKK